jgi:hypothetical protein
MNIVIRLRWLHEKLQDRQSLHGMLGTKICVESANHIEELHKLIDAVVKAVEDEGVNPEYHKRTQIKHRGEWPTLWSAIDSLSAYRKDSK